MYSTIQYSTTVTYKSTGHMVVGGIQYAKFRFHVWHLNHLIIKRATGNEYFWSGARGYTIHTVYRRRLPKCYSNLQLENVPPRIPIARVCPVLYCTCVYSCTADCIAGLSTCMYMWHLEQGANESAKIYWSRRDKRWSGNVVLRRVSILQ